MAEESPLKGTHFYIYGQSCASYSTGTHNALADGRHGKKGT